MRKAVNGIFAPPLYRDWLDDRPERFRGGKFPSGAKGILGEKLPTMMPARDPVMAYTGAIRELGNKSPDPFLVAVERERGLPYDSIAECYAVWMLRHNARREVQRTIASNLSARGPLNWLYRSRNDYQSITHTAWFAWRSDNVSPPACRCRDDLA